MIIVDPNKPALSDIERRAALRAEVAAHYAALDIPTKPAFSPTIDDAATDALRSEPVVMEPGQSIHLPSMLMPGTLRRVYADAEQRAIDRLEARLTEAFERIAALESELGRNGMGYRG